DGRGRPGSPGPGPGVERNPGRVGKIARPADLAGRPDLVGAIPERSTQRTRPGGRPSDAGASPAVSRQHRPGDQPAGRSLAADVAPGAGGGNVPGEDLEEVTEPRHRVTSVT